MLLSILHALLWNTFHKEHNAFLEHFKVNEFCSLCASLFLDYSSLFLDYLPQESGTMNKPTWVYMVCTYWIYNCLHKSSKQTLGPPPSLLSLLAYCLQQNLKPKILMSSIWDQIVRNLCVNFMDFYRNVTDPPTHFMC